MAIDGEDPQVGSSTAEAHTTAAPMRRIAAAAMAFSVVALGTTAIIAVSRPAWHGPALRTAKAQDTVGLEEAKPGALSAKMAAMMMGQPGGAASGGAAGGGKGWYTVMRPAILREGEGLDTPKRGVLQLGDHVLVSETDGHRAKIQAPQKGWVSVQTPSGQPIIGQLGAGVGMPQGMPQLPHMQMPLAGKKMSASELRTAIQEHKLDPNVVMPRGMGKVSGFLSDANKRLSAMVGQPSAPGALPAMPAHAGPEGAKGADPYRLPSLAKVQAMVNGQMPQGATRQVPQGFMGQDALSIADKMLHKEGSSLQDAGKGLSGTNKDMMQQRIQQMQDNIRKMRKESE